VIYMNKDKLDQLRDYYQTTDTSTEVRHARRDERTISPDEAMVSTSIRLPRSLMQRVRERAAHAGVPASALMRQWVLDRLDTRDDEAVVPVADLERFIAERARRAA
jgi:predicted DNA-binding protein